MSSLASPPPATPAVTSATSASSIELLEAVTHFFPTEDMDAAQETVVFERASGGVNNKCYFVKIKGHAQEYVLRIYNNGNNTKRVAYEHAVLSLLSKNKFSFELPIPIPARDSPSVTHVLLASGTSCCFFPRLAGIAADASSKEVAHAIGSATAELVKAMENVNVELELPNPLYRNMYDAHHFVTRVSFYELMQGPRCDVQREAANDLLKEMDKIEALTKRILALPPSEALPEQQIHADLHTANVLISPDGSHRVSAVLDFEFCARDWRVMELVVGLSKYIATPAAEGLFEAYVAGYKSAGGTLTSLECEFAPELIITRVLNNVVYFVGRALAGEDELEALTTRMDMYAKRCAWIRSKQEWMIKVLKEQLLKK